VLRKPGHTERITLSGTAAEDYLLSLFKNVSCCEKQVLWVVFVGYKKNRQNQASKQVWERMSLTVLAAFLGLIGANVRDETAHGAEFKLQVAAENYSSGRIGLFNRIYSVTGLDRYSYDLNIGTPFFRFHR
jgi:hypothetical protein